MIGRALIPGDQAFYGTGGHAHFRAAVPAIHRVHDAVRSNFDRHAASETRRSAWETPRVPRRAPMR